MPKIRQTFKTISRTALWRLALGLLLALIVASSANGQVITGFLPEIFPFPPLISEISNTPAASGLSVTVKARITPQEQETIVCPNGDDIFNDCTKKELQFAPLSTDQLPENPPPIVKATLFYYLNGENGDQHAVAMHYNDTYGKWEGEIPGQDAGAKVTYYIAASDAAGNVASMARVLAEGPAFPNWDPEASTPAYDNCSDADYHPVCNQIEQATPQCNSTEFTVNDPFGSRYDTCGYPDAEGLLELNPGLAYSDIRGLSVWADSYNISLSMGLNSSQPPEDSPPINGLFFLIVNPDLPDPNPYDLNLENAYLISYMSEAQGTDPTMVKVLWDAGCMYTSGDPLSCKLLTSTSSSDLQISGASDDEAVRIQVKRKKALTLS